MMKYLLALVIIFVSVGIFLRFIDPLYKEIQDVQIKVAQLDEALTHSKEILSIRDSLLDKFNSIPENDLERLVKMVPDNVDNIGLILEIDRLVSEHAVTLKDITVSGGSTQGSQRGQILSGTKEDPLGTIILNFVFSGSYSAFRNFLLSLERSLRLLNITALNFAATEEDLNQYHVTIETYWLK